MPPVASPDIRTASAVPTTTALSSVTPGTAGVLALGSVPARTGVRLAQLGLRAGVGVTVLARTTGGGRLIGVGTGRVGLDRETSRQLELRLDRAPA